MKIKFEYKVVFIYLIIGCLWILFSDHLLEKILNDSQKVIEAQTYKGWFYVLFTAALFFFFLKKNIKQLRETERKALESDRLKSAFLANMSHEIRTPMNGIIGFSKLLKDPDLTLEQQSECATVIEESGRRMLTIINDLLALSQLEAGRMILSLSETNINERILYLYDLFKLQVDRKEMQLIYDTPLPIEKAIIKTDNDKLTFVLIHLLQNAIKFSTNGFIKYGYQKKGRNIEFYVTDSGIGIPANQLNLIFNSFIQVDQSFSKSYEGVGLGLSIAKAYVELLGGKIWVNSTEGVGSTFYFRIPC